MAASRWQFGHAPLLFRGAQQRYLSTGVDVANRAVHNCRHVLRSLTACGKCGHGAYPVVDFCHADARSFRLIFRTVQQQAVDAGEPQAKRSRLTVSKGPQQSLDICLPRGPSLFRLRVNSLRRRSSPSAEQSSQELRTCSIQAGEMQ